MAEPSIHGLVTYIRGSLLPQSQADLYNLLTLKNPQFLGRSSLHSHTKNKLVFWPIIAKISVVKTIEGIHSILLRCPRFGRPTGSCAPSRSRSISRRRPLRSDGARNLAIRVTKSTRSYLDPNRRKPNVIGSEIMDGRATPSGRLEAKETSRRSRKGRQKRLSKRFAMTGFYLRG